MTNYLRTISGFFFAQSVLIMTTAMVIGVGFTKASTSRNGTAILSRTNCDDHGGITSAASIALLAKASAYWVNGSTLRSTSVMESPPSASSLPISYVDTEPVPVVA